MTAWHRRDMLLISLRMVSWGMALHSSNNASSNSWSVWGWYCRLWRRLPIKSQRCSIQFRSGLRGGQSMTWIPESSRKRVVTLEVCALAPSCINTKSGPISCAKGRLWFCTTTSTYLSAVKFARMKMRSVLLFKEIHPQTISDPPPYATVCSKLGGRFRSPLRRHTMLPKDKQTKCYYGNCYQASNKSDISGESFDTYFILSSVVCFWVGICVSVVYWLRC